MIGTAMEINEDKLDEALKYQHDVGFDEGYEVGYEEGYNDGVNAANDDVGAGHPPA